MSNIDETVSLPGPTGVSWWYEDALRHEGENDLFPSLSGSMTVDVAIVGGGFTGLWTSLALKQRMPSLSVALIEASRCGAGASSRNGGKTHGYWASLAGLEASIGADGALAVARAGTVAQDAIREFATTPGRDVWWRESGNIRVSASSAQDAKIATYVDTARRLGVSATAQPLSPEELAELCRSPAFRGGVLLSEGATVHPGRLVNELRRAAVAAGVSIYERTPMVALDKGTPNRIRTANGEILAKDVVLATNVALASQPDVAPFVSVFSSFAVMTAPSPESIAAMNWTGEHGLSDMRMFVHYFRKTIDGRVLMGSGSGPISYGGNSKKRYLEEDIASARRAERGLRRLLPAFDHVPIVKAWGGAIDVSSDRLPMFRTIPGTRVHYGCGYSGHGVNPTYIGGQCLASLVLGEKDFWSSLPFCTRESPRLPPEPFRFVGGRFVRWGALGCEDSEDRNRKGTPLMRAAAAIPRVFGLRIGVR